MINNSFDDQIINYLDDIIPQLLNQFNVPGCAIAIVHNNNIITKGYGVKNIKDKSPVDDHTIFAIASCTKTMTATAIGILVDEGKIKWDDLVIKYLPDFKLSNAYATNNLTIRDILCHRSGLDEKESDILWLGNNVNTSELIGMLQYLNLKSEFRTKFNYNNVVFAITAEIIKKVTGIIWQEFIKSRILDPLDMKSSFTSISEIKNIGNVASPHAIVNGILQPIEYRNLDNIAPSGAINSNVTDMAHWLSMNINSGRYNNKQIINIKTLQEIQSPQIDIPSDFLPNRYPKSTSVGYGLGWFITNYENRKVLDHGGGIDGMVSMISIIPEEKLGIVVLTNNFVGLHIVINNMIFDKYFKSNSHNWVDLLKKREEEKAKKLKNENENEIINPNLKLENFAGTYDNVYGPAIISFDNKFLRLKFMGFEGVLKYQSDNVFQLKPTDCFLPTVTITFERPGNFRIFAPNLIDTVCMKTEI